MTREITGCLIQEEGRINRMNPYSRVPWQDEPERGQISSLNTTFDHIPEDVRWVVLALVDQPAVAVKTYQLLLWAAGQYPERIIIPRFQGKRGYPIVLPGNTWPLCRKAPSELGWH